MLIYFFLIALFCVLYLILIISYWTSWTSIPTHKVSEDFSPDVFLSVVIAVRNEEEHIGSCIKSILRNNFPKPLYEIIIVNDHSTDKTQAIIEETISKNLRSISITDPEIKGKKAALQIGIEAAKGEYIITTDGDCIVPANWLLYYAYYFQCLKKNVIVGAVGIKSNNHFIERFQSLDVLATMGVTAGAIQGEWHYAANGSNLGFQKSLFIRLGGFKGNEHFASGDDMFFIHKVARADKNQIAYIKNYEHCVWTKAEKSWTDLIQQRTRWASKTEAYTDIQLRVVLVFLFIFNGSILLNFLLIPFLINYALPLFLLQISIKLCIDFLFLKALTKHYRVNSWLTSFPLALPFFSLFYLMVSFLGLSRNKYEWKDRQVQ